jgi:hypothetical protein
VKMSENAWFFSIWLVVALTLIALAGIGRSCHAVNACLTNGRGTAEECGKL